MRETDHNSCMPFSVLGLKDPAKVLSPQSEDGGMQKSDLHGENLDMMLEVYGSEFQKVWRKTRRKWWV